jgi:hypothetical protein
MIRFRFHKKDGQSSIASQALGTVGVLLVALVAYLSVDTEAHHRFHHDADGPEHHCVITAYAAGEALLVSSVFLVRPVTATPTRLDWHAAECLHPAADLGFAPICGPPGSLSSV